MCWRLYTIICGDSCGTVIPYNGWLCDTSVPENAYFISNNITEIIASVIFSLQIGGTKYRIYLIKADSPTNTIIHKITENFNSNRTLDVTEDTLVTHVF